MMQGNIYCRKCYKPAIVNQLVLLETRYLITYCLDCGVWTSWERAYKLG